MEPLAEREKEKKSQLFNLETHFSFIITFWRVQRLAPRDVGRNCCNHILQTTGNPMPTPVGWVVHYLSVGRAGPASFPTSGNCQRSDPKATSSLGPAALPLAEPHFHPSHTLPETLQQDWVPIRALHCWRTGSGRTANWGSKCKFHFCHPLTCCVTLGGSFSFSQVRSQSSKSHGWAEHSFSSHHLCKKVGGKKGSVWLRGFEPVMWGIPQRSHWGSPPFDSDFAVKL